MKPFPHEILSPTAVPPSQRDPESSYFLGRSILSVHQFDRTRLRRIFDVTGWMHRLVERQGSCDLLRGRILANLFYEPSTRTSSSFAAAMARLGGSLIPINEVTYSSVAKGESLPDTVRTLECYADLIVLRHYRHGAAAEAASYASKPIINAGDGTGEHPTQALLDLYTIYKEQESLDGLTVTLLGDLKHGRTVHSLVRLLSLFRVQLRLVSPTELSLPEEIKEELRAKEVPFTEHRDLMPVLPESDILYVTRVQRERFQDAALYERLKGHYVITPSTLRQGRSSLTLMHPFPRVDEIHPGCDEDPRAAYFRQVQYGLYVRMALIALVLGAA